MKSDSFGHICEKINIMTGFFPHEFLPNQNSSLAMSVLCRTCNPMVGVQYFILYSFAVQKTLTKMRCPT